MFRCLSKYNRTTMRQCMHFTQARAGQKARPHLTGVAEAIIGVMDMTPERLSKAGRDLAL